MDAVMGCPGVRLLELLPDGCKGRRKERHEVSDYIEREAALVYAPLPKHLREYQTQNLDDAWEDGYFCALDQIRSIPAADVRPVVLGKWSKELHPRTKYNQFRCSVCGKFSGHDEEGWIWKPNFCPNCGADCRGDRGGK